MSPEARLRSTTALGGCVLSGVLALALCTSHSPRTHAQTAGAQASQAGPAGAPRSADGGDAAARAVFAQSLAFRSDRRIADSTHAAMGWLAGTEPVSYRAQGALGLRLTLRATGSDVVARDLGDTLIFGGNLATHPFPVNINLRGVPDGDYEYVADVGEGETSIRTLTVPVKLVAGLDAQQADVERRLARIAGHDSAKASIRYPFDLARVINLGKRVLDSAGVPRRSDAHVPAGLLGWWPGRPLSRAEVRGAVGGTEDAPNLGRSRDMVTALQQNGVPAVLKEYAGATHDAAPSAATPDILTFFAANGRK